MFDFKVLLADFPPIIQYVVLIGIVLVLIYLALIITRFLGKKMGGDKIYFDDPEAYDKTVPPLFGERKRKSKKKDSNKTTGDTTQEPREKDA